MKFEFNSFDEVASFVAYTKRDKQLEDAADICRRLSDLEARYGELFPKVAELERRLAEIAKQTREVTAEEASEALNDDMLRHARAAIIGRYGDAALGRVRAMEAHDFRHLSPGDSGFLPQWRDDYIEGLMKIEEKLQKEAEAQPVVNVPVENIAVAPKAATAEEIAAIDGFGAVPEEGKDEHWPDIDGFGAVPETGKDEHWHWCEGRECSEPVQIDHAVYLNTQTCPKCNKPTLHEAKTDTRKGAADERLEFLKKQRAAAAEVSYIPQNYIEEPAQPALLPVADEKPRVTVKDCIAFAAELRRNNPDTLPLMKRMLVEFGIPTLNKLPEDQAAAFMDRLRGLR